MKSEFLNGVSIYRYEFKTIMIIGITMAIPIQIFFLFFSNYLSVPYVLMGIPIWQNIIQMFFIMVSFSLLQVPFIVLFRFHVSDFDFSYKDIFIQSFRYFFLLYLTSIFTALVCIMGMFMFVLPGILLLVLLLAIPQSIILEENNLWKSIRYSISFGKANLGKLLFILFIFFLFDIFLSYLAYVTAIYISNLSIIINFFFIAINGLLIPIFIFTLSSMYTSWNKKL
ncbi:hypothetical protein [Fictibacillus sp. 18YEL24]|uniref:hypothetical protein n=1 Tax=Fictibacillus sp. 18YEL24 TaxID=2745875 RepID=UPI0018CDDFE0|nr:hypothetical protein [Fictibacillus sp. 18YEL24]MBH0171682.1 hypothetical protein [Fictibacillus sp. 18YEL24]